MKKVKFYFELKSTGSLANVFFFPELENTSVRLDTNSSKKIWKNEFFELLVEDPFEYVLQVFGVTGTEWEAELKIISGSDAKTFYKWKGTTGDTRRNISVRNKPVLKLP